MDAAVAPLDGASRVPRRSPGGGTLRRGERGFTLMETMIALGILAVVAAGVLPLGLMATKATENQGHLNARTTEYAQDKLEQLVALAYGDVDTDTRVFPAAATGGSGLIVGGNTNINAPSNLYVDYLDIDGNVVAAGAGGAAPANWYYIRAWQITQVRPFLKQITVTAAVRRAALNGAGPNPQSTVSVLKTDPF